MFGPTTTPQPDPTATPLAEARERWNPRLRRLHDYWVSITPPDRLPGRRHFDPTAIPDLLPNIWLLEVQHEPFRLRYRLAGTSIVQALKREVTGQWLDDVHPKLKTETTLLDRYRRIVLYGEPSWRRGRPFFSHDPIWPEVENLMLPLATNGHTVDTILCMTLFYRADGREF
jgi:hypothetical protein